MNIYVDADACPRVIKEIIYRVSERFKIVCIFVSNQNLNLPYSEYIKKIVVPGGQDVADDKITELVTDGDLVITADIPLADRVVDKNAFALNPRGRLYDKDNIKNALSIRTLLTDLRNNGQETGGPPEFSKKDRETFANQIDKFLTKNLKKSC